MLGFRLVVAIGICLLVSCGTRRSNTTQTETQAEVVVQRADDEIDLALIEELSCHDTWGSSGSPTTYHTRRVRRKVQTHAQGRKRTEDSVSRAAVRVGRREVARSSSPWWSLVLLTLGLGLGYRIARYRVCHTKT